MKVSKAQKSDIPEIIKFNINMAMETENKNSTSTESISVSGLCSEKPMNGWIWNPVIGTNSGVNLPMI